jgi:hypothetical protein
LNKACKHCGRPKGESNDFYPDGPTNSRDRHQGKVSVGVNHLVLRKATVSQLARRDKKTPMDIARERIALIIQGTPCLLPLANSPVE